MASKPTSSVPGTSAPRARASLSQLIQRWVTRGFAGLLVLLVAIQLVPFGRNHTNPPVQAEPAWDSPQTRALFMRACGDCHTNQTTWPWYSSVAPVSWLIQRDVNEGRQKFNISEWGRPRNKGDEAAKTVRKDDMPPWFYTPIHPDAKLSTAELQTLIAGLTATFGDEGGEGGEGHVLPASTIQ
ncbi:MAG: heme-binding domain-containing protein [Kouleothrix sp.]|nr:heme-binding domain-containing protein [Kouleothrix sp.]